MTPNEITTVIASALDRELDIPFRLQLMERVRVWRSRLIANALQKNPDQRKFFRQTLYLTMEEANSVPCAELINCKVARTVNELPKLVRVGSQLFDYVGGADGKSPFKEVGPGMGGYIKEGRFSHLFPPYEFINNRIATDKSDLPLVRVDGIFDDPQEAAALNCDATGTSCDPWNEEFPCSGDVLQLIIQSIQTIDYNRPERTPAEEVK